MRIETGEIPRLSGSSFSFSVYCLGTQWPGGSLPGIGRYYAYSELPALGTVPTQHGQRLFLMCAMISCDILHCESKRKRCLTSSATESKKPKLITRTRHLSAAMLI